MKRLIYITFVDFKSERFNGVIKKIKTQISVFENSNIEVICITQYGNDVYVLKSNEEPKIVKNGLNINKRKILCRTVEEFVKNEDVDYCYFRFQFFCNNVLKTLKTFRTRGIKTVIEIPTYPYEQELYQQGVRGLFKLICDKLYRKNIFKYVDRIVTYSDDKEIFGVKTINTANGVDFSKISPRKLKSSDNSINIIAVASMFKWHGYDRFIKGLSAYYKNGGIRDVHLHLVGDGNEMSFYKSLITQLNLNDKITVYGTLTGIKLDEIYDKCDLGLSMLALHRKKMSNISSLKSIEYAAKGVPFITGCEENAFSDDFCYKLKIPSDETNIEVNSIINFYDEIYKKGISKKHIVEKIRSYAMNKCDVNITMKPVIDFFNRI